MNISRRSFLFTFLGAGAVCGVKPASARPIMSVEEAMADIDKMAGVQPLKTNSGLVFLLRPTKPDPVQIDDYFWGRTNVAPPCLQIDKQAVQLGHERSVPEWRYATAALLLHRARVDLMVDDKAYLRSGRSFDDCCSSILIRRRNTIAKMTRRGCGNVLVGSRKALQSLSVTEDWISKNDFKVATFEDGEVVQEPFLLIGYAGKTRYDAGIMLAHSPIQGDRMKAAFVCNATERYWTRLI